MIVLGIDVGGTSIKGAAINDKGAVLDRFSLKVSKSDSAKKTIGALSDIINDFVKTHKYKEKISGIGIGVPGIVDFDNGNVIHSPNLPTWEGFNIKEFLQKSTNLPVILNNDANVAALGESIFGSGKNYHNVIMLTLGTGVGGGIILNQKIFDGNLHQGAELGHMVIRVNGKKCGCGRKGCLEAYASATALIRETKKAMKAHPESLLHHIALENAKIDARTAFLAAKQNDKVAKKIVDEYVQNLSEGILNFCNIFRPEIIVLSGGVANEGEYLFSMIREYLKEHNYGMKHAPFVDVQKASLGYDSGIIGAACLVLCK